MPISLEIFRKLAMRSADAILEGELEASFQSLAERPETLRAALQRSDRFTRLPADVRTILQELPDRSLDADMVRRCLDLPEQLARASGTRIIVAIDEFQELGSIPPGRTKIDPFPLMRSLWQRHEHVGYIISGSARSMLHELTSSPRSRFFQHFSVLELLLALCLSLDPPARSLRIATELCESLR